VEIQTIRFGLLDIEPDKIITFKDGVPGFDDKRFILLTPVETAPFSWLQSVDSPELAFAVLDPAVFVSDYNPQIDENVFIELEFDQNDEILVLAVTVVPSDIRNMTVNLAAPIVINVNKRLAKQEILSAGNYPLRYNLYKSIMAERVNA
jgi:flagellar assembly factor FliW